MRIFNWVQNRLNGRKEKKDLEQSSISILYSSEAENDKEELGDWRQGLLAIGTLGNNSRKEEDEMHDPPLLSSQSSQDVSDFTIEEVMKLHKELSKLLKNKQKSIRHGLSTDTEKAFNLPVDRLLNPASLKIGHDANLDEMDDGAERGDLSPNSMMILRKARDLLAQNRDKIRRKSITYLLKNVFICRSGFAPAPCLSLRDPIVVSSMEKLLRIMLHKKIFPQSSAPMEVKKYLENKPYEKVADEDKSEERDDDRSCKWDKTDSDFIVLEI